MDNTISGRRLAGFFILALVIVVGTLAFGLVFGDRQPADLPSPAASTAAPPEPSELASSFGAGTPPPSAAPTQPAPTGTARPVPHDSDAPIPAGTIPPFVPVPSGPVP